MASTDARDLTFPTTLEITAATATFKATVYTDGILHVDLGPSVSDMKGAEFASAKTPILIDPIPSAR